MRILITTELEDRHLKTLRDVAPDAEFIVATEPEEWDQEYRRAEVVFGRGVTPERVSSAANLDWVQVWSAGVDRYMFPAFVESDITLTNVRGMHAQTIADHVYMFMLVLSRNLHLYLREQLNKVWKRDLGAGELAGTTLGIIGLGGIGSEIARRGVSFGQRVVAIKRHPEPQEGVDVVLAPADLPELLQMSDYVVLACPLTPETQGLMGPEEFAAMKESAYLINIARGEVVREEALITALQEGAIAGAGLDVFEEEPLPESSPLWEMENVVITPHMAGSQRHYMDRAIEIFAKNLRRYREGRPLMNVVDKRLGY